MNKPIDFIEYIVCADFGIDPPILHQRDRRRMISEPRQIIIYLASREGHRNKDISQYFEIDHATVHYAYDAVTKLRSVDKCYRNRLETFEKALTNNHKEIDILGYFDIKLLKIRESLTQLLSEIDMVNLTNKQTDEN